MANGVISTSVIVQDKFVADELFAGRCIVRWDDGCADARGRYGLVGDCDRVELDDEPVAAIGHIAYSVSEVAVCIDSADDASCTL